MTARLTQIIALANGQKAKVQEAVSQFRKILQAKGVFDGFRKTYKSKFEEGDQLPSEKKIVQARIDDLLAELGKPLVRLWDLAGITDLTNCTAKADVVVGGKTLLSQVPTTYLLYLDNQMELLEGIIKDLPTLSPDEEWAYNESSFQWESEPKEAIRLKKTVEHQVVVQATDKFPAQVAEAVRDIPEGVWTTVSTSGSIPAKRKRDLLNRVFDIRQAIRKAREQANSVEIFDFKGGQAIFDLIFKENSTDSD